MLSETVATESSETPSYSSQTWVTWGLGLDVETVEAYDAVLDPDEGDGRDVDDESEGCQCSHAETGGGVEARWVVRPKTFR